ncbi:PQQ-binding-like beta-propeller repeat protein [Nocardiopsis metallicus]|uniref:Pyrrolo-quinoline quinone n=1 Tax=Nocardiopsis metallicus TaxID=179819 RepID=A0A840VY62_9ACTN|nr:PQQ-binding-like beta-propeller repeat protein [Nocardiopsis metallicus]MBB5489410.1 hypothetical protein [Nocardiopsis metallicus]
MTQKRAGNARTVLSWAGAGLVAGSLVTAAMAAWTGWGSLWDESRAWWLFPVAAAVVVLYRGLTRLLGPDPERMSGIGASGGVHRGRLLSLGPFVLIGLVLIWSTLPTGAAEALTKPGEEFRASQTAVRQWLTTCGLTLGFLFLLPSGAARARPRALPLTGLGAGALAVLLPGALVGPVLFPYERHTVAERTGEAAPVPAAVTRQGWAWVPPAGTGITEVVAGTHGPLVLLADGAVALDGRTGEELWTYRLPHPGVGPGYARQWNNGERVWADGELVYVEHPDDITPEGPRVVALDARTGAVVEGDHPGLAQVRADTEQWRAEASVAWSQVVGDGPGCHQAPSRPFGDLMIGVLACAERAGDFAGYSGLAWAQDGPIDFALVAVDPAAERELWRREWSARDGGRVRWFEALAGSGDPVAVLEPGPGLAPVGLDPATGEEVLDFPEGLLPWEGGPFGPVRLQADTSGLVVVVETDEETTRLQRSTPEGETVAAAVLDEVPFADTVPRRAAVLDGMVLLPVGSGHERGRPARVLAVPLPGAGGGGGEEAEEADLGTYPLIDVLAVPGAAVVVVGDQYGPTGLRGLLP